MTSTRCRRRTELPTSTDDAELVGRRRAGRHRGDALNDPFGTAGLRASVLAAWTASPARFREDANAEEDLVLGGYRDRVLIELAQNAADAAARAGRAGRLRFELERPARSCGRPTPVRRSTRRGSSRPRRCGRRRSVTDARRRPTGALGRPVRRRLRRGAGGHRRAEIVSARRLGQLVARRAPAPTSVRIARWPTRSPAAAARCRCCGCRTTTQSLGVRPKGFDTEVVLPLRDAAAVALVRGLLDEIDAVLLLTLRALADGRDRRRRRRRGS